MLRGIYKSIQKIALVSSLFVATALSSVGCVANISGNVSNGYTGENLSDVIVRLFQDYGTGNYFQAKTDEDGNYSLDVHNKDFLGEPVIQVMDEEIECDEEQSLEECVGEYYDYVAPIEVAEGDNELDVTLIHFDPMDDSPHYEDNLTFYKAVKPMGFQRTVLPFWSVDYPINVASYSYAGDSNWESQYVNEYGVDFEQAIFNAMDAWNLDRDYFTLSDITREEIEAIAADDNDGIENHNLQVLALIVPDNIASVSSTLYVDDTDYGEYLAVVFTPFTHADTQEEADVEMTRSLAQVLGHRKKHGTISDPNILGQAPDYLMDTGTEIHPLEYEFAGLAAPDGLIDRNMDHYRWD